MINPTKLFPGRRKPTFIEQMRPIGKILQSDARSTGKVVVRLQAQSSQSSQDRSQETEHLGRREQNEKFEREVMRHLDAAFNLAMWLLHNPQDAEDATQSALYKAFRAYEKMRSNDAKPWLLAIVRNECMDLLHSRSARQKAEAVSDESLEFVESVEIDPETAMMQSVDSQVVLAAIDKLPSEFREVILLREIEEMSYLEIAQVIEKPIGTVMSRLARARGRLQLLISVEEVR